MARDIERPVTPPSHQGVERGPPTAPVAADPRAKSTAEKLTATVAGIAEGFAEESRNASLPESLGVAAHEITAAVKEVRRELRGGDDSMAEPPAVQRRVETTTRRATAVADRIGRDVRHYKEGVRESTAKAREGRAVLMEDIKHTGRSVKEAATAWAIGAPLLGIFGLLALGFLSTALAFWLEDFMALEWAFLWVALIHVVLGIAAYAYARGKSSDARHDVRATLNDARTYGGGVVEPLRRERRRIADTHRTGH